MRSDRSPAICKRIGSFVSQYSFRIVEAVVEADKGISVGIISVNAVIYGVECEVVTAVSVLCLVIDNGTVYLYTAGREVTLEIVGVILSIPKTPLCKGEE